MSGHITCSEAGPVAWRGGLFISALETHFGCAILLFRCAQQSAAGARVPGQQPAEATRLPASRRIARSHGPGVPIAPLSPAGRGLPKWAQADVLRTACGA